MTACLPTENPSDCRARLLLAACEAFAAEGYRVGVDRIASAAGVAKQTLYNHFQSKAELFAEVIRQATSEFLIALGDDGEGLRERLVRFGARYREKLLAPAGLGLYRMLVAETARFPELAAAFYAAGPQRTAARLRTVLEEAMRRGELRADDPEFAVTLLLSMLVGHERSNSLFCGEASAAPDPAAAGRIVDCFLRAFAPEPERSLP
ncbi:MAG: TetR/AcrR family transcriptional regulator [Pseudomonadota bacterium]